ncbi:MAG TPA: YpdA family putative bacillithiol disulfide reductase [Phnomibacter sp.]|nr:YpdA family putative bacillithiol disulfide reductase [Phnomibacter sp.]
MSPWQSCIFVSMEHYDIVIIGGGPIGLACGIAAKRAGKSYVIVEKGCLVNSLYNYPANMTFFSTAERLEIGNVPFTSLNAKPNRAEALEYYRRVTALFQLNIRLFEAVQGVSKNQDEFTVTSSKTSYTCRFVIVATGFYDLPVKMNIPGEDLPKVTHYYKDPHYYAFQQVLVAGGNNSAVDAALETWRKGAHVTMVMMEGDVGERVKYWVRPDVVNRIKEGSIKAYTHSTLAAIREGEVDIQTPEGLVTIPNDFVIAMTGYQPNFTFLANMGIALSNDEKQHPSYNPETMETNVPGLYLAGVVCGGMDTHIWFIENSREHADRILRHIQIFCK